MKAKRSIGVKVKRRSANREGLASDLAGLSNLDRAALVTRWQELYGTAPPRGISQALMIRAIAYRVQEQALGGLKPSTQRFLAKVVDDASSGQQPTALPPAVKPGTRLLREWHGVTHEVILLENGAQYQNKRYRSLSEVARAITATRWSGPLFFGLKTADKERVV